VSLRPTIDLVGLSWLVVGGAPFPRKRKLNSHPFLMGGGRIIIGSIHHTQNGPLTKSTTKQSITQNEQ
jgi:hypothetical protein